MSTTIRSRLKACKVCLQSSYVAMVTKDRYSITVYQLPNQKYCALAEHIQYQELDYMSDPETCPLDALTDLYLFLNDPQDD